MCKYWHEDDVGQGLVEICRLVGKIVSCCSGIKDCEYVKERTDAVKTD